jgi:hypothetical protein
MAEYYYWQNAMSTKRIPHQQAERHEPIVSGISEGFEALGDRDLFKALLADLRP